MERCATCEEARQKCTKEYCVIAPYLPANNPEKYACLSAVFDMSGVVRAVMSVHPSQRQACVYTLCFEAEARLRDPVWGCVGIILRLLRRVRDLKIQLKIAQAQYHHLITRSRL